MKWTKFIVLYRDVLCGIDGLHKTYRYCGKIWRKWVVQMRRNVAEMSRHKRIFWPAAAAAAMTLLAAALLALGWFALRGCSTDDLLLPHLRWLQPHL